MGYKHKNDIKDFMWSMFWMTHEVQKADIDLLEDDIKTLIKMTTQKTAGQRKDKMKDINDPTVDKAFSNVLKKAGERAGNKSTGSDQKTHAIPPFYRWGIRF